MKRKFACISNAKLKREMFVDPQIRELFKEENFETTFLRKENRVWTAFKNVCRNFLSNKKLENYKDLVEDLIQPYKTLGVLKLHFLHLHLQFSLDNLRAISDEHDERFYQQIAQIGKGYSEKWILTMFPDYIWTLKCETDPGEYKRKKTTK